MTTLPPYPAYKDSGVPWFDKIPAHWNLPRLGSVLCERGEQNSNGSIDHVLSVLRDVGVIPYEEKGNIGNKKSEDITRYKIVRPGDIVLNSMNVIIGSVGLSKYEGCLSPVYYVLKTQQADDLPKYYATVFQMRSFQQSLVRLGNGILAHRLRIPMELLKAEPIPQPPPNEQAAIVRYLDHVDRSIRRYIRAKQRLLALLAEQKQAIIHQAVTRGLDPAAPLKPSGVAWLGDVPAHWEVVSVRRLISFITSGSRGWAQYYSDNGDLFIQSGNLGRAMNVDLRRVQRVDVPSGVEGERTKIQQGDILVCVTGALTGNVAHVEQEPPPAYINQHVALLRLLPSAVLPRYLAYALHAPSGQKQFKVTEYGGTKQGLGLDDVRNVVVALPDLNEQGRIVLELDSTLQLVNIASKRVENQIDLLREYRTRLIADVVTGQVDVRAAAAALPAEIDETDEPLVDGDAEAEGLGEDATNDGEVDEE